MAFHAVSKRRAGRRDCSCSAGLVLVTWGCGTGVIGHLISVVYPVCSQPPACRANPPAL
jgi:hypothetical protein